MKLASFEAIVRALDEADVRYLIAGGLAVNAHGYLRFTKDIDIVLQLDRENTRRALTAMESLGYRPTVPVEAKQFADAAQRAHWIREKSMQVFQLWSDDHRETPIDIFVEEPFAFDEEFERALIKPLYGEIDVRFVSLPTLIDMKKAAGRPQDLIDLDYLNTIRKDDDDETQR
jgi:hypothetical protein